MDCKNNIAGVVVLFNPPENIKENIGSYIDALDILYVVDNSENYDVDIIHELKKHNKINYISNGANLGIAKALNIGACNAIEQGHQWLLTMDQDSKFQDLSFFQCFNYLENVDTIAIISPYHFQNFNIDKEKMYYYEEVDVVMTSGNLLNLALFKKIGKFEEKLFIDEVDHDYCIRARLRGYRIVNFINIPLTHHFGIKKQIIRRGKLFEFTEHSAKRMYYITRNNFYVWKKYYKANPELIKSRIKNFALLCKYILFYEDKKVAKIGNMLRGCFDFMINKYGR